MKNKSLIALFLAVLIASPAFALGAAGRDGVTVSGAKIKEVVSAKDSDPVREIKLVRFSLTNLPAVVSGDVLVYDTLSFDDGITVRKTTTSADGTVAGVAVTAIQTSDSTETSTAATDLGRRNWGYVIIHGPIQAKISAGGGNGCSAGDSAVTSSDSGAITTLETVNGSTVTGALLKKANGKFGFFMDACDGSSALQKVFVENE